MTLATTCKCSIRLVSFKYFIPTSHQLHNNQLHTNFQNGNRRCILFPPFQHLEVSHV